MPRSSGRGKSSQSGLHQNLRANRPPANLLYGNLSRHQVNWRHLPTEDELTNLFKKLRIHGKPRRNELVSTLKSYWRSKSLWPEDNILMTGKIPSGQQVRLRQPNNGNEKKRPKQVAYTKARNKYVSLRSWLDFLVTGDPNIWGEAGPSSEIIEAGGANAQKQLHNARQGLLRTDSDLQNARTKLIQARIDWPRDDKTQYKQAKASYDRLLRETTVPILKTHLRKLNQARSNLDKAALNFATSGHTFSRPALQQWLKTQSRPTNPLTRRPITNAERRRIGTAATAASERGALDQDRRGVGLFGAAQARRRAYDRANRSATPQSSSRSSSSVSGQSHTRQA